MTVYANGGLLVVSCIRNEFSSSDFLQIGNRSLVVFGIELYNSNVEGNPSFDLLLQPLILRNNLSYSGVYFS